MVFEKRRVAWNKGKPMSDAQKLKISSSKKGMVSWNKGIPMSAETKQKMSIAMSNPSPETRLKMSIARLGTHHSPETIKKLSLSHMGISTNKGIPLSEERKRKIRESTKIATNTQEFRANQSIRSKKMWADPIFKDNQIKIIKEVHNRPDVIKNHARAYAHRPHKNTDIEIILEKLINSLNIKYESQKYTQFGVPDFFVQPNICIFADGNYDHTRPNKIEKDKKQTQNLENIGYIVYRFWGSDIKKHPEKILNELKLIY